MIARALSLSVGLGASLDKILQIIMDQMEAAGIVGAAQGAKPRAVLMDAVTLESIL